MKYLNESNATNAYEPYEYREYHEGHVCVMRVDCNTHYVLPLEGSREACNPHQAVYLTDVV